MTVSQINNIVEVIKINSKRLSEETSWLLSDEVMEERIIQMFNEGDDSIEIANYFESISLLSTQFALSTESKFPAIWNDIKLSFLSSIIYEVNEYYSKYNVSINWEQLFLDRVVLYSSGELNILLNNIVSRSFLRLNKDLAVSQNREIFLENNSRLFSMWFSEPLVIKPIMSSEWKSDSEQYKNYDNWFLEKYFLTSIDMLSEIKNIIN